MLELLKVHGFRTLVNTEIRFDPLTIMIGKNGVGKTTILDSLQLLGNFSRGGIDRAFGPPPWSLSWQRTKGIGFIPAVRFEVQVKTEDRYNYVLSLSEKAGTPQVTEERLMRPDDNRTVASLGPGLRSRVLLPPTTVPPGDGEYRGLVVGRQGRVGAPRQGTGVPVSCGAPLLGGSAAHGSAVRIVPDGAWSDDRHRGDRSRIQPCALHGSHRSAFRSSLRRSRWSRTDTSRRHYTQPVVSDSMIDSAKSAWLPVWRKAARSSSRCSTSPERGWGPMHPTPRSVNSGSPGYWKISSRSRARSSGHGGP